MNDDRDQTNGKPPEFDFSAFPPETLFYDRRSGQDRRKQKSVEPPKATHPDKNGSKRPERRERKERRRRVDPTTFEKQYTGDELEFMNAMQKFKEFSGKQFPTHGEVLRVAAALGYRKVLTEENPCCLPPGPEPRERVTGCELDLDVLGSAEILSGRPRT
jgi:hypothetical protein